MTTPDLNYIGEMCVDFDYHMRGIEIGTFIVYRQQGSVYIPLVAQRIALQLSGQQGTEQEAWINSRLTIRMENNQDRVRFTCYDDVIIR